MSNTSNKLCGHNRCISLESCGKGDIVFVVWSMRHGQFVVVQDSSSLYFVHGDSLHALNLRLPPPTTTTNLQTDTSSAGAANVIQEILPTIPLPFYGIGRVVDKEYCAARKDENRYRVTKGSRFYRIKLSPLSSKASSSRRDRMELSSVSRSISQCEAAPGESFYAANTALAMAIRPSRAVIAVTANATIATTTTTATANSSIMGKDMIDYVGGGGPLSPTISASVYKERTISVTSVTTDDGDEPLSLLSDCGGSVGTAAIGGRYLSVSEEDEYSAHVQQQQQQQSVITEQPTATVTRSHLEMLANSAVLPQIINTNNNNNNNYNTQEDTLIQTISTTETLISSTAPTTENEDEKIVINQQDDKDIQPQQQELDKSTTSPLHQLSIGGTISIATTSEDSDEYRSLEPKEFDDDEPETEITTCTAE